MLAFHRFIFSTFLLLALGCFWASSAFAAKILYYYKSASNNFCSLQMSSVCSYTASTLNSVDPTHYKYSGCSLDYNSLALNRTAAQTFTEHATGVTTTNWIPYGFVSAGSRLSKQCNDSDVLTLTGCTATCEADPCAALEGIEEEALVTCGVASCPSPETFNYDGSTVGCSNGAKVQFVPTPAVATVIGSCAHTLKAGQGLSFTAKAKTSATGSSTQAFCHATYVNDGISSADIAPIENVVSLSFGGVTPTTENGQCPDGTVKGEMNGQWVCVADSNAGEGSGCPTGQIKNNSGECVPFSQAGTGSGDGDGSGDGNGGNCPAGSHPNQYDPTQCLCDTPNGCGSGSGGSGDGDGTGGTGGGTGGSGDGTGGSGDGSGGGGGGGSGSGSGGLGNPALKECTSDLCSQMKDLKAPASNTQAQSWYVSEYENGLQGIWQEKSANLKDTHLITWFEGGLNLPENGSCPSFSINLGQFGTQAFAIPCYVFDFVKVCILFSAIMLSRRIIFGG